MYFSSFLFLFLLRRQDALREDDDGICFFHWIKMRKRARGVFFLFFGGGGGGKALGVFLSFLIDFYLEWGRWLGFLMNYFTYSPENKKSK
jgi:hypothetical protein